MAAASVALTPSNVHLFPWLAPLKANADNAEKIAMRLGLDLPTLAIRFALSEPSIRTVLIGSNKIKHMQNAIGAAIAGSLSDETITKLKSLAISDPAQVDPRNWKAGGQNKL